MASIYLVTSIILHEEDLNKNVVATNRKAFHNFNILETYEAGIVLEGYEVKSLRLGQASLLDSLVRFENNEAYLENAHIAAYSQQSTHVREYNPRRRRKILLHRAQIRRLLGRTYEKGLTLIPLEIYFSARNLAKLTIGLAKGKRTVDKRDTIRRRDMDREMERELK